MRLAAPAWVVLFLLAAQADGKARISDFDITVDGGRITADFVLASVFDEALVERIQTGLPTGFDFKFRLIRPQRPWLFMWPDRTVAASDFQVVAMYNAVTKEYLVNYKQDGKLIESRVLMDIDELEAAMTRFIGITIFNTEGIKTNKRLHVRARAVLGSKSVFFLIPTTIRTDWEESERFRLPRDGSGEG